MNFLELCQKTARESGTVAGTQPATVVDQVGRLGLIVDWVNDAWRAIQNGRPDWLWMQAEGSFTTLVDIAEYDGTSPAVIGPRFEQWLFSQTPYDLSGVTIYRTSEGRAQEGHLRFLPWEDFRRTYGVGIHASGKPLSFTVDPRGRMVLHPMPDDEYTIRSAYKKSPQELTTDTHVPELPAHRHDVIWRSALLYLAAYDENQEQPPFWAVFQVNGMNGLVREQTPAISRDGRFGG